MLRAALTVGFLTLSSSPEVRPLPPELQAARIVEGTVRLSLEGGAAQQHLTLFPEGVCFTSRGYETLNIATQQLQANLRAVEARVKDYEVAALQPRLVPEVASSGWTGKDVALAVVAGVLVGAGGVLVLTRAP